MKTIEATATTTAAREAVWPLLADLSKWPQWGSWSNAEVEAGGEHARGAIRILQGRGYRVRERVTEWEPGERMGYELLDGMKVRGYRSTVSLEEQPGGGTLVRWRSTYEGAAPWTALILRLAVRDSAKRLARARDRLPR